MVKIRESEDLCYGLYEDILCMCKYTYKYTL